MIADSYKDLKQSDLWKLIVTENKVLLSRSYRKKMSILIPVDTPQCWLSGSGEPFLSNKVTTQIKSLQWLAAKDRCASFLNVEGIFEDNMHMLGIMFKFVFVCLNVPLTSAVQ